MGRLDEKDSPLKPLVCLLLALPLGGHVGSPDVYLEGAAGPYPVLVTVRPPVVIPGVAEVEVRALGEGVERVSITPTPMSGPGAQFAPAPDQTKRDAVDRRFFTGTLWMMSRGSWQVRVRVEGANGACRKSAGASFRRWSCIGRRRPLAQGCNSAATSRFRV